MSSRKDIIVITGSNTGLGYEAAKILAQKPHHLIITSRTLAKAEEAVSQLQKTASKATLSAYELDVASPASVFSFAEKLKQEHDHIDVLINNAAVSTDRFLPPVDDTSSSALAKRADLFAETLATNVIGPETLTTALLPLLLKSPSPRLLFVSSGLGSLSMNADPSDHYYAVPAHHYRVSKAALNMLMLNWQKELKDKNVGVWGVCPGFNATGLGGNAEMARKMGAIDPEIGGGVIADVAEGKRVGEEGKVVAGEGIVRPW